MFSFKYIILKIIVFFNMNKYSCSSLNSKIPTTYIENPTLFSTEKTLNINKSCSFISFKDTKLNTTCSTSNTTNKWKDIMNIDAYDFESIRPHLPMILSLSLTPSEVQFLPIPIVNQLTLIMETVTKHKENDLLSSIKLKRHMRNRSMALNNKLTSKHRCGICKDKCFISQDYLDEHMKRRHLHILEETMNKSRIVQKRKNKLSFSMKLDNMKHDIGSLLLSTQMKSSFNSLNDKVNALEKKILSYNNNLQIQKKQHQIATENLQNQSQIEIVNQKKKTKELRNEYIQHVMKKIHDNIEKNAKLTNHKFQDLFDDLDKFKLSISNEISSLKQMKSFERAKLMFESETEGKFKFMERRQKKLNTVKELPNAKLFLSQKEISNQIKNEPVTNLPSRTNTKEEATQIKEIAEKKQILVISNEISENISDIVTTKNKKTNLNVPLLTDEKKNSITSSNFSINKRDSSSINTQTQDEKEIQTFYTKFKLRDRNLNGHLSDYLQIITPDYYVLNNIYLNTKIEQKRNECISEVTSNKEKKVSAIKGYSKEKLIDLIKRLYENIGDKSTISDFYGYYSKNLDFLFDIKNIIDKANKDYFMSKDKEKEKLRQSTSIDNRRESYGKIFDIINYNVLTSGAFSFKESD